MISARDAIELKKTFDQIGYVSISGFLNKEELKTLKQALEKIIIEKVPHMTHRQAFFEDKNDSSSLKQIQDLHTVDPYFHNLLIGSRFEELVEVLLADKVVGKNLQYFNKPAKIGEATPPHQDGFYFKLDPPTAATMWLAIEDVDEENGCIRYIPGSHLRGQRPHNFSSVLGFSQGISDYGENDYSAEVRVPVKAGDLLIHHAMTIHRADSNQSATRSRQALGLVYFGESAEVNALAKEAYLKELEQNF
ncbi:MAG: phytanoyl-CoA dioxygenase family protein [Saprospiraceae bacterium]|nr:phytanoyl-CoA dioxygenase family protein [Saprospiraceae bacterium]